MGQKRYKPLIIFILGPTGVGKSEFAVRVARRIKGEIISCDSMQVYKGMPILSQQPEPRMLEAVPHHLIGFLSPSQEWNAATFIEKASRIAGDIVQRGHVPIVVGGTGLYARTLLKGLFLSPPKDEKLRKRLYKEARRKGKRQLYERLLRIDPAYASKIHANDLRRVVRALEVYELSGKPISEKQREALGIEDRYEALIFVLNRPRNQLYSRINKRIEKMFSNGVLREVEKLKRKNMGETAKAVLGYKEISGYLRKCYGLDEAKERLKRNTRHYAKRQLTWFRREKDANWLELGAEKRTSALINIIVKNINKTLQLPARGVSADARH